MSNFILIESDTDCLLENLEFVESVSLRGNVVIFSFRGSRADNVECEDREAAVKLFNSVKEKLGL
jgi:hypothetical protein